MGDISNTQFFRAVQEEKKLEASQVLEQVYTALTEKGYNPINQIVGYIMSGDPTYITSHKSARSLIMKCWLPRLGRWRGRYKSTTGRR